MAKNTGKAFESQFQESAEKTKDVYVYRVKDSASSFNPTVATGLRFTPKNDYDYFMYRRPFCYPIELKSNQGTSFSFQKKKEEKAKDVKLHQIIGLSKASVVDGVFAGFLFNFSTVNRTYWLNIVEFMKFFNTTEKKSINEKDIAELGGILVEQTLKKVKYSYNIEKMLNDITKKMVF